MGGRRKGRLSLALPRRTGAFTPRKNQRTCPRPSPAPVHFRMRGTGSCLPLSSQLPSPVAEQGPVPTGCSLSENGDHSHSRSDNNG